MSKSSSKHASLDSLQRGSLNRTVPPNDLSAIAGYKVHKILGRGGMATVYLATQLSFGRPVALKIMLSTLSENADYDARFLAEARMAASLSHPNIITVYDVGHLENSHYIAMEYHPNGQLADMIAKSTLEPKVALNITKDLALALNYAHSRGIVHRDIKPDNVLFSQHGAPILTDFGIARNVQVESDLTKVGSAVGTPKYMSPEQARGHKVDGRSDLYSLGIMLYEMLTGHAPFYSKDSMALAIKHCQEAPPPLPSHLKTYQPVIDRLLAKSPEHRYQTGAELVSAIDMLLLPSAVHTNLHLEKFETLNPPSVPPPSASNIVTEKALDKRAQEIDDIYRISERLETVFLWIKNRNRSYMFNAEEYDVFAKKFQRTSDDMAKWLKKHKKRAKKVHFSIQAHPWIHKRIIDKFIAVYPPGFGFGDFAKQGTITLHLYAPDDPVGRKFMVYDQGKRAQRK